MSDTRKAREVEKGAIVHDVFEDGLRFIVMRGPASWCGYVGIPEDHPLAGHAYDDIGVRAHGGLTFSSKGGGAWPKGFWWYGWDYAHSGDHCVYDGADVRRGEQDWSLDEVIKDSWETLYEFKAAMRLAEAIAKKASKR